MPSRVERPPNRIGPHYPIPFIDPDPTPLRQTNCENGETKEASAALPATSQQQQQQHQYQLPPVFSISDAYKTHLLNHLSQHLSIVADALGFPPQATNPSHHQASCTFTSSASSSSASVAEAGRRDRHAVNQLLSRSQPMCLYIGLPGLLWGMLIAMRALITTLVADDDDDGHGNTCNHLARRHSNGLQQGEDRRRRDQQPVVDPVVAEGSAGTVVSVVSSSSTQQQFAPSQPSRIIIPSHVIDCFNQGLKRCIAHVKKSLIISENNDDINNNSSSSSRSRHRHACHTVLFSEMIGPLLFLDEVRSSVLVVAVGEKGSSRSIVSAENQAELLSVLPDDTSVGRWLLRTYLSPSALSALFSSSEPPIPSSTSSSFRARQRSIDVGNILQCFNEDLNNNMAFLETEPFYGASGLLTAFLIARERLVRQQHSDNTDPAMHPHNLSSYTTLDDDSARGGSPSTGGNSEEVVGIQSNDKEKIASALATVADLLAKHIMASGREQSKRYYAQLPADAHHNNTQLQRPTHCFTWHHVSSVYLGAAHGTSGVLASCAHAMAAVTTRCIPQRRGHDETEEGEPELAVATDEFSAAIRSFDHVAKFANNEANYKSSLKFGRPALIQTFASRSAQETDSLHNPPVGGSHVQWCHGAGGVCMNYASLFTSLCKVCPPSRVSSKSSWAWWFKKWKPCQSNHIVDFLMQKMLCAADTTFTRGNYTKSAGLCHGTAANALSLLAVSRALFSSQPHVDSAAAASDSETVTPPSIEQQQTEYQCALAWHRAVSLACSAATTAGDSYRYGDHSLSLYEGMAGTLAAAGLVILAATQKSFDGIRMPGHEI